MKRTFPSLGAVSVRGYFSRWDLIAVPLILGALLLLALAFQGSREPFSPGTPDLTVSLDPRFLPYYGLRSFVRMLLAVFFSLLFTFTYATLAAKSRRAEKVMIPVLDFLQSLPILGFLTVTTTIFLGLFRGNALGLEAASIFAIFTSQVWNMAFSFYYSLTTIPRELNEAAAQMRLSSWQKFWKLEVPFATPSLLWNTMMSVSGGWFFVVASEVISVVGRGRSQFLPGIGAYIGRAIQDANVPAMVYAGVTLLIIVLIYDQLLFRPIVAWAEKFKFEQSESADTAQSWMLTLMQRARLVQALGKLPAAGWERLSLATSRKTRPGRPLEQALPLGRQQIQDRGWNAVIGLASAGLLYLLATFMFGHSLGVRAGQLLTPNINLNDRFDPAVTQRFRALSVQVGADQTIWLSSVCSASQGGRQVSDGLSAAMTQTGILKNETLPQRCAAHLAAPGQVSLAELPSVFGLGLLTLLRVMVMIVVATLIWVPVGVWIGLNPRVAQTVQPLAQFLAAFPANLIFPVFVVFIARFHLSPNIFLSPLIVLGTQWYILFNVIAGTIAIPTDLKEAARVQGLRGWVYWKRLILPSIFPAFVTGGITASGGSWNASIVAEVASWGATTLSAAGLGAYIAHWSTGEFNPHVALGMLVMGLFVLSFNRLFWRRLYTIAEERYRLG
jgi:NitT/TauT family transport system permease protein